MALDYELVDLSEIVAITSHRAGAHQLRKDKVVVTVDDNRRHIHPLVKGYLVVVTLDGHRVDVVVLGHF